MKCDVSIGPISVYGYMGAFKEEKALGKEFYIKVDYSYNCEEAAKNDDLYKSIDYSKVVEIVKELVSNSKDDLIETTAYRLKEKIISTFSEIENLSIEIDKRNPPLSGVASFKVTI